MDKEIGVKRWFFTQNILNEGWIKYLVLTEHSGSLYGASIKRGRVNLGTTSRQPMFIFYEMR